MNNKKGWIRIVEAFVSLIFIIGVLLIVLNKGGISKEDISSKMYDIELSILREIELNDTLREDILKANRSDYDPGTDESPLPINWSDFNNPEVGLLEVRNKINERLPNYLGCEARICEMNRICVPDKYSEKEIYAQSVAISANLELYSPRQLKLFCWVK